ncbi:hypothetical protein OEB99_09605 [Actinotalea sp. M2MS4P-6]|uniref:hypothetical protein n=1 Tax=Actinotalea sp. M2MS4P-6 TaxID=2983762 RepID=UPI0021E39E8A|nr:hypothetical protein [Actinotalea sp. M2MS4P-6]MCV2394561.1 hypothetical protein [Actinotalea sp. M2MS4P-6]
MPQLTGVGGLVLWLVQITVPLLVVTSVVLALRPRPRRTPREATLGRAQWLTVAVGLVVGYLVAAMVIRHREGSPLALLVFLTLCATVAAGGALLRWAWRVHATAVLDEQPADEPPPPRPHEGLSGGVEPPRRW